jgi:phage-related protein
MEKIRTIIAYKHYFEDFLLNQPIKVQMIPSRYLDHIEGTDGLYETKYTLGSDIWRVFCFFDEGRLVILLNGFQKKTQKTPKSEIALAEKLKKEYFEEKRMGSL